MRVHLLALVLAAVASTSLAEAKSYQCGAATQNWQSGSATTCPYDSNGGGPVAAVPVAPGAPVIVAPPVIVDMPAYDCGALSKDSLPLVLRKHTVTDFAGNISAPEEGGCK